jgi:molybdopterin-synthase adenylyltransferase
MARAHQRMTRERVLIVGLGGLGVPAASALARGSRARLTLIDPDPVELSNLARQVIYRTEDIGVPKAEVARRRLQERFGTFAIEARRLELTAGNARALVAAHDFVIDATDNPAAKFLINDACVAERVPFAYGGVLGMTGQAMTVLPGATPCLRCLFETPPDEAEIASCRDAGIIGPVAGAIGEVQAAEAMRVLGGRPAELAGAMLTYDASGAAPRVRITPVDARRGCDCHGWRAAEKPARAAAGASQQRGQR